MKSAGNDTSIIAHPSVTIIFMKTTIITSPGGIRTSSFLALLVSLVSFFAPCHVFAEDKGASSSMDSDILSQLTTPYLPHDSPSEHLTQKANS